MSFIILVALLSIDSRLSNASSKLSYLMGMAAVIIGLLIATAVKVFTF